MHGPLWWFDNTVFPGFRVLGLSALPGFRALKAGYGAWLVHKTQFEFRVPLFKLFIRKQEAPGQLRLP